VEKIHENAPAIEIRAASLAVVRQRRVRVHDNDVVAGEYLPDLLVELKTVKALDEAHMLPDT